MTQEDKVLDQTEPVATNTEQEDTQIEPDGEASQPQVSVDEIFEDVETDEKDDTNNNSKEIKRQRKAEKLAESWAKKLANEEISEDDVPEWVREKAIKLSSEIKGSIEVKTPNEIAELKKEINDLKKQSKQMSESKETELAKKMVKDFLKDNEVTESEFKNNYGDQFISDMKRMINAGFSKSEATRFALSQLSAIDDVVEGGKKNPDIVIPNSTFRATQSTRGVDKELAEYNETLKKMGISPMSKDAFLKAKEAGVI